MRKIEKRKRGRPKGIPRAATAGRKKGTAEKTKWFLGCRVTPEEHKELDYILQSYKKKYKLKTVEVIKKIFFGLQDIEKFELGVIEEKNKKLF